MLQDTVLASVLIFGVSASASPQKDRRPLRGSVGTFRFPCRLHGYADGLERLNEMKDSSDPILFGSIVAHGELVGK